MSIEQALQTRIKELCQEKSIPSSNFMDSISENTTIEDIELICDQFGISLADFFVNDLFQDI